MKKVMAIGSIIVLLLACSKSEPVVISPLNGSWRLISSSGGIAGAVTIYPADSVYTLELGSDSTFTRKLNGNILMTGQYSLSVVSTMNGHDTTMSFSMRTGYVLRETMVRMDGALYLGDQFSDGYSYTYRKTGN